MPKPLPKDHNDPPVLTIHSPVDGETTQGGFWVDAHAFDWDGISAFEFTVDPPGHGPH